MKKFIFYSSVLLLFSIISNLSLAQVYPVESLLFNRVFYGWEAQNIVPGSELVKMRNYTSIPEYIKFRNGYEIEFELLESWINQSFRLEDNFGLKLLRTEIDQLGFTHYRYQQTYNSIPIEGAIYIAHVKNGVVRSLNGVIFNSLNLSPNPALSEELSLNKALEFVNAKTYMWEVPEEEELLKFETNDPNATYYPGSELVFVPKNGNFQSTDYHLAYKFDVYASQPLYRASIFVDAITGEIIFENNRIQTADVTGTAVTAYSDTQTVITDAFGGSYRLREAGRGLGIETYNMETNTNYGSAVDFTDGDNFWNNVNANQDEVATDAHWGAEMTYDYLLNEHGRNSIDNAGFKLRSYVHYGNNYSNAFWNGSRMTYGDGDGSGSYSPFTALDIAGHEIAHGLMDFTADLVYSYESGALNESFSDIWGTSVEFYGKPASANWLVGEDIGAALRSMSNPNAYGDPDTYLGTNWATGPGDNGGVHTNSGVQNFWFYLLANGGSGTNDNGDSYNITGIGLTNAAAVAYRNLSVYLWANAQYADARFYAIQSAIDLFGPCTPEVIATTDAWYAVGVGAQFNPTVTSDFTANPTSACSAPFTVNFSNLSNNGGSFYWDFGDGNTGTDVNPSHIYDSLGTFTVSLIADGGACGIDTVIKIAYIQVDTLLPCIVIMPLSGTGDIQTSCTGTLYDNGGPAGTYADNTTSIITIAPTGASTVTLNIILFDIEPGSGGSPPCDYDYVEFFDGPNTTYPSFGRYCNTTGPPASPFSSSGGSITIKHYADPAVNGDGFEIAWSCNYPNTPPVPDFTSDTNAICSGLIRFIDLSTNGPVSWLWDFGDGNTSIQQNPAHTYVNNGTYTVKLIVTNGFGSDSLIRISYITVSRPPAPASTSASRCGPGSVNLSASGTDILNWYDDSVITANLVNTGSVFTTPSLSTTTDYYVEEVIVPPSQYVGPPDNTYGAGNNYTGNRHLIFDCYTPLTIVSVLVYAQGSKDRTIQLRRSNGAIIQDTTMYIQDGATRITLNFDVPVDNDLQLGISGVPDLFRNNSTNTNYPYTLPGYLSITGSNAPADYYYFYYDWEVREPICISERAQVTATINEEPTAAITASTNTSCNGSCEGDATVSGSGGTPPYTYLWSSSGQSGLTDTALCAGQHDVVITDANGCTDTTSAAIIEPVAIALEFSSVDATCGNADGEASVSAADGVAPYTYLWDDFNTQTTPTATGLPAGTYAVIVTDNNGCTSTGTVTVNNTVPVVIISAVTNISCNGTADGQATASASGGVSPYTYQWDDPDSQTTALATGLAAGTYTITVTDSGFCFSTATVTLTEPPAITLTLSSVDASCGNANGEASVSASNGVIPYTYLWDDPGVQTTAAATGLAVGSYTVLITDANGCNVSGAVSVNDAGAPVVTLSSNIDVSCNGGSDGEATISASGGIMPYTYLWDDTNAQTTVTATGLTAGTYTITVTDFSGCVGSAVITINEPLPITLALSSVNASCGNADGQASVIASNGVSPYIYLWDDSAAQTTPTATGLFSGTYTVTITDANGCTTNGIVAVNNSVPVVNISSWLNVSCSEGNDGEATVAASGGTPGYTYSWSTIPVQTTATATGLVADTYTVSVTDAAGCVANAIVTINQPAQMVLTTDSIDANCGQSDGGVSVSATGGTGAYTYLWDDPDSSITAAVSGLAVGTYFVVVTDANGCNATASATVNDISGGTASISASTNASCNGACDGDATASMTGGTPPYAYLWDDPFMPITPTIFSLCAGTYNVTVTDINGCADTSSVTITEPPAPDITTFSNDATPGACDGNAIVSVNGGTPPYAYQWDAAAGSQTTTIADSLCPGTYAVTVTDAKGCTYVDSVNVGNTTGINNQYSINNIQLKVYPNPSTGEFMIMLNILKKQDIEIKLLNIAGQLIFREKMDNLSGSCSKVFDVKDYAKGVYTLQIIGGEGVINTKIVVE